MHLLQAWLGHAWFASHGSLVAVPLAIVAGGFLGGSGRRLSTVARATRWALISSTLVLLMLVPAWIYGELRTQDGLGPASLREHGIPTLLAISGALYTYSVVSGALALHELLRGRR